jgi:AcrR family transcriptional regulator
MGGTVKQPRQARSRETMTRLTHAAFEVVCRKGFEGATVPDIVGEAGLSTGAFYARFPSKEALFEHLDEYIFERSLRMWREELDPAKWTNAEPETILREFIDETASSFERQRILNRSVAQRWRSPDATPRLQEAARAYYRGISAALVRLLEPHEARFTAGWRFRIGFLVEVTEATLLERVAFAAPAVAAAPMTRDRAVEELTDLALSYLAVSRPAQDD